MRLEVNVTKKRFFVILGAILLLSGMIAVYAYNADWANNARDPATYGHSPDEIVGDVKCSAGQALTITNTGWGCVSVGGGTGGSSSLAFAGYTPQTTTGNGGGLVGMNAKCNAAFTGSKMCTEAEALSLWRDGALPALGSGDNTYAWIHTSSVGHTCYDWADSRDRDDVFGSIIFFDKTSYANIPSRNIKIELGKICTQR